MYKSVMCNSALSQFQINLQSVEIDLEFLSCVEGDKPYLINRRIK